MTPPDNTPQVEVGELKPCPNPWCETSKPALMRGGYRGRYYRVQCETCGTNRTINTEFEAAAVAAWNTRATPPAQTAVVEAWLPIESAPKDGTIIWAIMRDDIYPDLRPGREDLKTWNGVQIALRHPGVCDDGFDMGWNVAAPVGHGGFPDEWIAGWMPLPKPPTLSLATGERS